MKINKKHRGETCMTASSKEEENRIRVREWRKNSAEKYKKHQEYVKEWKRNNAGILRTFIDQ
jgi:hypothetical protein